MHSVTRSISDLGSKGAKSEALKEVIDLMDCGSGTIKSLSCVRWQSYLRRQ